MDLVILVTLTVNDISNINGKFDVSDEWSDVDDEGSDEGSDMEDYNNDIDDESVEGSSVGECYDSTGEGFESGENVECGDI